MNIGKIEIIKTFEICDFGKNININQKGKTPRLDHR